MAFHLTLTRDAHFRGEVRKSGNGYIVNGKLYPSISAAEVALMRENERRNGAPFETILKAYRST